MNSDFGKVSGLDEKLQAGSLHHKRNHPEVTDFCGAGILPAAASAKQGAIGKKAAALFLALVMGLTFWAAAVGEDDALRQELAALEQEFAALETELAGYESEVRNAPGEMSEAERTARKRELRDLIGKITEVERRREALNARLAALAGRIGESEAGGSIAVGIYDPQGRTISDVLRNQSFEARVEAGDLPGGAEIRGVRWTLERPGGLPSIENSRGGEGGLTWPLRASAESVVGVHRVEAEVQTAAGAYRGSASFTVIETEDEGDEEEGEPPEPGEDAMAIEASVDSPLYTGKPAFVRLSGLPFEVENPADLQFTGLGAWAAADFWIFRPEARQLYFRPKKEGSANPRFMLSYKGQQAVGGFSVNVERTELETEVQLDRTDLERLTVPFEALFPDYFRGGFTWTTSSPKAVRVDGAPQPASGGFIARGHLDGHWLLPGKKHYIMYEDGTGAEAVANLELQVYTFDIELPSELPDGDEDIPLEIKTWRSIENRLGGIEDHRIWTTPNVRYLKRGSNASFWLTTEEDEVLEEIPVRIAAAGKKGLAHGEKKLELDFVCCDVPSNVRRGLSKIKNPMSVISRMRAAAADEDEARAAAIAREYARDMQAVFDWWAGLDKCRHLSRRARDYFGAFSRLLDLAQLEEPNEDEAMRLMRQLQQPLGPKDIKAGFMCDEFETNKLFGQ